MVVCLQIGTDGNSLTSIHLAHYIFSIGATDVNSRSNDYYGDYVASLPTIITNSQCDGSESLLIDCTHDISEESESLAVVTCYSKKFLIFYRNVSKLIYFIIICFNGVWCEYGIQKIMYEPFCVVFSVFDDIQHI